MASENEFYEMDLKEDDIDDMIFVNELLTKTFHTIFNENEGIRIDYNDHKYVVFRKKDKMIISDCTDEIQEYPHGKLIQFIPEGKKS